MKRFLFALAVLIFTTINVQAEVVNVDLDKMIEIGLNENCDLKMKRLELDAAKKDIKIANRLQNPEIQTNVVLGNVALGNASQAGV